MSSMESKIASDINDYERACIFFRKEVVYSHGTPDCYSASAKNLIKRLEQAGHGNTSKATLIKIAQEASKEKMPNNR